MRKINLINKKKGDMSLQVVVAAVILLVVLVVVIMIFMKQTGKGSKNIDQIRSSVMEQQCELLFAGGKCMASASECANQIKKLTPNEQKQYLFNAYTVTSANYKDCQDKGKSYTICCKKEKKD